MSIGKKLLMLALAAPFVVAEAPTVQAAPARKPPLCTAGRFAVSGAPLLGPGGELLVLENKSLAIGTLCPTQRAKLKRLKRGTSLRITFPKGSCSGVSANVRIIALISDDCSLFTGTLRTKGRPAAKFTAGASVCGDGVVDPAGGEACDGSATGCQTGEVCNDRLPVPADARRQVQPDRDHRGWPQARRRQYGYRHRFLLPDRRRQAPDQAPGGGGGPGAALGRDAW